MTGRIPVNGQPIDRVIMEEYCGRFSAAYADAEALSALAQTVRERPVTLEKQAETHLSGTFTAGKGQKLMFTIPWDEGWTFTVDGTEVEPHMVLDVFMALDVPEGTHSYEMRYTPSGLRPGLAVSAAALVLTVAFLIADGRFRKRPSAEETADGGRGETETTQQSEEGEHDPV